MATQSLITVSPDGRYVAAQVHHFLQITEQSTGAAVALPSPEFTLVADAPEAEGDDGEGEGDEAAAEDAAAGDAEEGKKGRAKKAKHATADAAASDDKSGKAESAGPAGPAGPGQRAHEQGARPIRVLAFHPDPAAPWFMYNSAEKYIHLYHRSDTYESGFKHIITVCVPRKVQQAIFHPLRFSPSSSGLSLPQLLVADKTGDIHLLHGLDLSVQSLQLAHLANVTQMHFYRSPGASGVAAGSNPLLAENTPSAAAALHPKPRNFLITSDSDAKIRVSNSPNFFDIQSYCLGHPAFVSAFSVLSLQTPLIVSGGLGANLLLWNLTTGTKLGGINLAAHRPAGEGQEAVAVKDDALPDAKHSVPSQTEENEAAAAQGCYISSISVAETADGEFTLAVAVYPWPYVFVLQYSPSSAAHFKVTSVLKFDSPPQTLLLAPALGAMHMSDSAAAAASVPPRGVEARLWVLDQNFRVHARRRGASCGQWKDASSTGSAHDQKAVTAAVGVFANAFLESTATLKDTLITESNAAEFVGAGSEVTKAQAQAAAAAAAAGADPAAAAGATPSGPGGRYVSPFSTTATGHLARLALLTSAGFAFRRFFDKVARDKYVSAKRAQVAQRRADSKQQRAANKKANARQKRKAEEGEEGEGEGDAAMDD